MTGIFCLSVKRVGCTVRWPWTVNSQSALHVLLSVNTHTHTHTHTCNPSQPRTEWHTVYTIRILHAIGDGTLWSTTCNRGRFVYEYDSSLITGDVTGAHKFSSFVNVLYKFDLQSIALNSQGGDRPRFQNVAGLIVDCHVTYVPGWRRLQTHTHTHTHPGMYCTVLYCSWPRTLNSSSDVYTVYCINFCENTHL